MKLALKIDKLHKRYSTGTHALKGISLDVNKGDFFALLGPNGSGKTTMINIMGGATKKTAGDVFIGGKNIEEYREETKSMIGIVPQEISFDPFFTVNEVLHLQSGYYGIKPDQKYIDEILHKLNLIDKKNAGTRALSGGMKRRLLIAKALVHKPKIVVLDEPTAGVDVELRHNIWEYVKELNENGLTILLTTHYLEEAEELCNKIAIINEGELVALDNKKTLLKSMGNTKAMHLTFKNRIQKVPQEFQEFQTQKLSDHEVLVNVDSKDLNEVIEAINKTPHSLTDIEMKSKKLEEIFIKLTKRQ